jgi:hypothetical protein
MSPPAGCSERSNFDASISAGSSSSRSRIRDDVGWRKSALESKLSLDSSATTLPSPVKMSGFTSASEASVSSNILVELLEAGRRLAMLGSGMPILRACRRLGVLQPLKGRSPPCGSSRSVLGDFLDVHAALGRAHQHDALQRAVDHHRDVVLLLDVGALLDQRRRTTGPRARSGA